MKKISVLYRKGRREEGQALVEFALILPILLIIVLAIIGIVANLLFVVAENRVLHWHYGQRAVEGVSR